MVRKAYTCALLQGMSDLLSPILFVMEDESEAFWCFVSLMERLGPNFNRDQNGMHSQLFALSKVYLSLVLFLPDKLHTHVQLLIFNDYVVLYLSSFTLFFGGLFLTLYYFNMHILNIILHTSSVASSNNLGIYVE